MSTRFNALVTEPRTAVERQLGVLRRERTRVQQEIDESLRMTTALLGDAVQLDVAIRRFEVCLLGKGGKSHG